MAASLDADGNRTIGLLSKVATLFDGTKSAQMRTETVFLISPSNEVKPDTQRHLIYLCTPDGPELALSVKKAVWSAGRGYSRYLHEITQISKLKNGWTSVSAKGFESPSVLGKWELKIDPNASFIVREARLRA